MAQRIFIHASPPGCKVICAHFHHEMKKGRINPIKNSALVKIGNVFSRKLEDDLNNILINFTLSGLCGA